MRRTTPIPPLSTHRHNPTPRAPTPTRPQVLPSTSALLSGPPVRKLLFMADAPTISSAVLPYWREALEDQAAEVMQVGGRRPRVVERAPASWFPWACGPCYCPRACHA